MTTDKIIELEIESLAYGGEGIARVERKVYFVFGALPGEKIRAQVTEEKKNFARAEVLEILKPSKDRAEPPCSYFGRCGGCQLQHLAYEEQLVWKRKWLEDLLARIGNLPGIPVDPVVPSPKPYGYRNRVSLTLAHGTGQQIRQGFLAHDNRSLVDIDSCQISMPKINQALGELLRKNRFGNIFGDFSGRMKLEIATDGQNTFFLPWQTFADKSGWGQKPEEGKILRDKVSGLEFEFSPLVFFQVNPYLLPRLISQVGELAGKDGETCLFDLYSGVGLFGLSLAERFKKVIALEESRLAHKFALRNIKRNKVENVFAYSGRVETKFKEIFLRQKMSRNVVILDPPRGGVDPGLIKTFEELRAQIDSLIYLSCEPSILARDLARFQEAGFLPERVMPFDLFPQTQIFETVVKLRTKK